VSKAQFSDSCNPKKPYIKVSDVDIDNMLDDRKLISDKLKFSIMKMENVLSSHRRVLDKHRQKRVKEITRYTDDCGKKLETLDRLIGNQNFEGSEGVGGGDFGFNGFRECQRPDEKRAVGVVREEKKLVKRALKQKVVRDRAGGAILLVDQEIVPGGGGRKRGFKY
jgi:hypothetical protein